MDFQTDFSYLWDSLEVTRKSAPAAKLLFGRNIFLILVFHCKKTNESQMSLVLINPY